MLIRYSDGRVEPATLLGANQNAMCVAFSRGRTAAAFSRPNGQWLSDEEGPVEIDFTAAATEREWRQFCERVAGLDESAPWDAESLLAGCDAGGKR
ncbi:MAG: hypothetical protein ACE15B_14330 [Bryobacteraceae bacterium]